jgi:hypothetical protein
MVAMTATRQTLAEEIERVFARGVRAETALGLAARLGTDEDEVLDTLIDFVADGRLRVMEEGTLLIFLNPAHSRAGHLAA